MVAGNIMVNRAPVLTLWAAVVASRLGFDWEESLTLGRAVAGLTAQSKGRSLGIFRPAAKAVKEQRDKLKQGEELTVELLGRAVPIMRTHDGLRAVEKGKPGSPESVERYLGKSFREALPAVRAAMVTLAKSLSDEELVTQAFRHYERFRPAVPPGERGWGAKGVLDLSRITSVQ